MRHNASAATRLWFRGNVLLCLSRTSTYFLFPDTEILQHSVVSVMFISASRNYWLFPIYGVLFPKTEILRRSLSSRAKILFTETMARTLSVPGPDVSPQVRDLEALGALVRNRRLLLELRIDDAAHACGVAANVLSRLENGGAVGADRLLLVLSGLGLSMLVLPQRDAAHVVKLAEAGSSKLRGPAK